MPYDNDCVVPFLFACFQALANESRTNSLILEIGQNTHGRQTDAAEVFRGFRYGDGREQDVSDDTTLIHCHQRNNSLVRRAKHLDEPGFDITAKGLLVYVTDSRKIIWCFFADFDHWTSDRELGIPLLGQEGWLRH